jgi:hypothetical protein
MDATVMWGFILIGAGALVAGIVGIAIPPGERVGAFLTLVIGAGVGVAALAVGTRNVSSQSNGETAFLGRLGSRFHRRYGERGDPLDACKSLDTRLLGSGRLGTRAAGG